MSIGPIGKILFSKYMPPAGITLVLWDHCLTFDEEVTTIWSSFKGPILPKAIYVMNRYFTEAVLLYTVYVFARLRQPTANKASECASFFWLFSMSTTLFAGILQFLVTLRAYRLWDYKQTMRRLLLAVFAACMAGSVVLSVRMVVALTKESVLLSPEVILCAVPYVPKETPFLMGLLLLFNIFVISVSFYNALEEPRRREREVLISLRRHSAKVYFIVSFLWVVLLISSIYGEMLVHFPVLILVWSVGANLTSRMHLRIESLGLSNVPHPTMMYSTPPSRIHE
ncbi:hypothetical protein IW261DRAFT_894399 [Armillaria novae-zelandiae]|uniref:DUF6533 domain-containing protein n=1 Tax=Armillaria novae-zelandiae TaxID=153914 RepID=A0AA39NT93_9AGAR|nr:hypothetical protein IW261DRAFT_894399 [Armillaria novae-zelandiae]